MDGWMDESMDGWMDGWMNGSDVGFPLSWCSHQHISQSTSSDLSAY